MLLSNPGPLGADPGELDCRFATGGTQRIDFGSVNSIYDLGQQSDGSLVTLGSGDSSLRLSRFGQDGVLDASFGTGGTVTHAFPGLDRVGAMAIDGLDRIVVGGQRDASGDPEAFLARFTADGALDLTFGGGGWVSLDFTAETENAGSEGISSILIDLQGRVVVGGYVDANGSLLNPSDGNMVVARFDVDGVLDTGFGTAGVSVASSPGSTDDVLRALAIDSTGRLIATGSSGVYVPRSTMVAVWLDSGQLDTGFGSGGVLILDLTENGGDNIGFDLAMDSMDRVVVLGTSVATPALARLSSSGDLDTSFAGDGVLQQSFYGGQDVTSRVLIQADDRILVTGGVTGGFGFDLAVMRFTADGALDTTWSSPDGVVATNIDYRDGTNIETNDGVLSALLQSDGKVVVAGVSDSQAAMARYLNDGQGNGPETTLTINPQPNPSALHQCLTVHYSVTSPGEIPPAK